MRKSDLIAKLQEISGNPEVIFYNGFVNDWQHIKITEYHLITYSKRFLEKVYEGLKKEYEDIPNTFTKAIKIFKILRQEWEISNPNIENKNAKYKRVILIEAKNRNKKYYDRAGSIYY